MSIFFLLFSLQENNLPFKQNVLTIFVSRQTTLPVFLRPGLYRLQGNLRNNNNFQKIYRKHIFCSFISLNFFFSRVTHEIDSRIYLGGRVLQTVLGKLVVSNLFKQLPGIAFFYLFQHHFYAKDLKSNCDHLSMLQWHNLSTIQF